DNEDADREQYEAADENVLHDRALRVAARQSRRNRIDHRDADDKYEERKHEIGRRPAIPLGMLQRPIGVLPIAIFVDEDHQRDGKAAEYVERDETFGTSGRRDGVRGSHG